MEYSAIYIPESESGTRYSGTLTVEEGVIHFSGEDQAVQIPFNRLRIRVAGNNKNIVFFDDTMRSNFVLYTSEKSVLNDPTLVSSHLLRDQLKVAKSKRRAVVLTIWSVLLFLALGIASLFFFKDDMVHSLANQVPVEWEQKMGDQLFATLKMQYKFIESDSLKTEFLKVAQPLIEEVEAKGVKIDLYFIQDATINAFALPGGKVVIHSGLIEKAKSWEEVMGVLGHELAHVTERHHVRGLINNLGMYAILSTMLGDVSAIAGTIISTGGQLASLSNSRTFETEADEVGRAYMIAAQMDPKGMISFFKTLEKQHNSELDDYTNFLSTHPATNDRIAHLEKIQKENPVHFPPVKGDFVAYQNLLKRKL